MKKKSMDRGCCTPLDAVRFEMRRKNSNRIKKPEHELHFNQFWKTKYMNLCSGCDQWNRYGSTLNVLQFKFGSNLWIPIQWSHYFFYFMRSPNTDSGAYVRWTKVIISDAFFEYALLLFTSVKLRAQRYPSEWFHWNAIHLSNARTIASHSIQRCNVSLDKHVPHSLTS